MAQDRMKGESTVRLHFMSNARSAIVVMVILLHTALAYAGSSKAWWIVVDDRSWTVADILCGAFDLTLMPALFFISGFFAPPSFEKYGAAGLMRRKTAALALPWVIGVVLLDPFAAFMTKAVRGIPGGGYARIAMDYLAGFLRVPRNPVQDRSASPFYFSHYHLWFLSLLFMLFAAYCLYRSIEGKIRPSPPAVAPDSPRRIAFRASTAILASSLGYAIAYARFGESWFVVSMIQFQISRIIPYACAFACGISASRRAWFRESGSMRLAALPLAAAAAAMLPYLAFTGWMRKDAPFAAILGYSLCRYSLCGLSVAGVLLAAKRYSNRRTAFNAALSDNSFMAYLFHLDVVIVYLALFTRLRFGPPWFQLPVVFALSAASSYALAIAWTKTRVALGKTLARRNRRGRTEA